MIPTHETQKCENLTYRGRYLVHILHHRVFLHVHFLQWIGGSPNLFGKVEDYYSIVYDTGVLWLEHFLLLAAVADPHPKIEQSVMCMYWHPSGDRLIALYDTSTSKNICYYEFTEYIQ